MTWLRFAGLLSAIGLAGCAHQRAQVVVREVKTPIAVSCAPVLPSAPAYAADHASLDGTIFALTKALLIDREQRRAREAELQAALEACR